MRIIEPTFKLTNALSSDKLVREDGIHMLRFIENKARISHASEDKQTPDSWVKFIDAVVLKHGDWSVTEHATITATIRTDRGITHELVRHRLFSFTQESTRFVRYKNELEFIRPAELGDWAWRDSVGSAEQNYFDMLNSGIRPQEARSVLPNSLASTIAMTGNLRSWRHFLLMRATKEAHPDMRRITIPMLKEFQAVVPLLYDDIEPNRRQIDNLRLPK